MKRSILILILLASMLIAIGIPAIQRIRPAIIEHQQHRVGALVSASGLATSQRQNKILWSHNDSGTQPLIYAMHRDGSRIAEVRLTGLPHVDYEEITSFSLKGKPYLLLADTGDNNQDRDHASIYILPEPELTLKNHPGQPRIQAPAWSIHFVYEDGPQDVEAVAVDPKRQEILLLTKRRLIPQLYVLPLLPDPLSPHLPFHGNSKPLVAKHIASLTTHPWLSFSLWFRPKPPFFNVPTAMELSPDGRILYVLTYMQLYAYPREAGESWAQALKRRPLVIMQHVPMTQAEGLTWYPPSRSLLLISEGYERHLMEIHTGLPDE